MSVKKQIPSLCKLYSFYEKVPEEFSDETDVDRYFYHNIFDISQSQHRIVRVSRGSNKKKFAIELFQFCNLKTQQRYILQEEVYPPHQKRTHLFGRQSAIFSQNFWSSYQVHTDSPTEAQSWDCIYKVERLSICSLL